MAFLCYRKKNKTLTENFEQLNNDDHHEKTNTVDKDGHVEKSNEQFENNGNETVHDHDVVLIKTDQIMPR